MIFHSPYIVVVFFFGTGHEHDKMFVFVEEVRPFEELGPGCFFVVYIGCNAVPFKKFLQKIRSLKFS